jgi:hypothetical protein
MQQSLVNPFILQQVECEARAGEVVSDKAHTNKPKVAPKPEQNLVKHSP